MATSNAGAIMAVSGGGGGPELVFAQSFQDPSFLGHSLKNDGPITVNGVDYTGRNIAAPGLTDLVFSASGLEIQMPTNVGSGSVGVIFDLDSTVIGADPITDRTTIALQTCWLNPAATREQQQYVFMGPSGSEIYGGMAAPASAPELPYRLVGQIGVGTATDTSTTVPNANFMQLIAQLAQETVQFWYGVGVADQDYQIPGTQGTYFDTIGTTNREAGQSLPRPQPWSASLGTLRAMITAANYHFVPWTPIITGYAVWRHDA